MGGRDDAALVSPSARFSVAPRACALAAVRLTHGSLGLVGRRSGINAWTENSRVVHATSPTADGTYTRREEVFGVFSHEPNAVRDPDTGEWALFYTAHIPAGASPAPHSPACNCTDGSTVTTGGSPCGGTGVEGGTYVSWSKSPDGPWTAPLHLFTADARQSDTNLAPVLLSGAGWSASGASGWAGAGRTS